MSGTGKRKGDPEVYKAAPAKRATAADSDGEDDYETLKAHGSRQRAKTDLDKKRLDRFREVQSAEAEKAAAEAAAPAEEPPKKKKSRWDTSNDDDDDEEDGGDAGRRAPSEPGTGTPGRKWDTPTPGKMRGDAAATPVRTGTAARGSRWDAATPVGGAADPSATPTPGRWGQDMATPAFTGAETPQPGASWAGAETPVAGAAGAGGETPVRQSGSRWDRVDETPKRTRWDDAAVPETPAAGAAAVGATPGGPAGATPQGFAGQTPQGFMGTTPLGYMGQTPLGYMGQTPLGYAAATPGMPEQKAQLRRVVEMHERNRPLTDAELDDLLPADGYEVVAPPATYRPVTPARKGDAAAADQTPQFMAAPEQQPQQQRIDVTDLGPDLPPLRDQEDYQLFAPLVKAKEDKDMTKAELKDITVLRLALKVKNGLPQQCKSATRELTVKAKWFGADRLCDIILKVLMLEGVEGVQRHHFVKLLTRVMYKLGPLVRPHTHKIWTVAAAMLIEKDYVTVAEGREVIANLSKAVGLSAIITAMNDDCRSADEYVRSITARGLAVVASALGVQAVKRLLEALCRSQISWLVRYTGIKTVQQIAVLMGAGVLQHLRDLVGCVRDGLREPQQKVKTMAALAIASLAEASSPYGDEAFRTVRVELFDGARSSHGKPLAAFLKAIGFLIPLMDPVEASMYTERLVPQLVNEMRSHDVEMRKIVLKVLKQLVGAEGVSGDVVRNMLFNEFFRNFWVKRVADDPAMVKGVIETTVAIAQKTGAGSVVDRLIPELTSEHEEYRGMAVDAVHKVLKEMGGADVQNEQTLLSNMLYAFNEQSFPVNEAGEVIGTASNAVLDGFAGVINALGSRATPSLPQVTGIVKRRIMHKQPITRMQAADLLAKVAKSYHELTDELMGLYRVCCECLKEEKPEVLGSILNAIKSVYNVLGNGRQQLKPPVRDLLPELIHILKNQNPKVRENCIDLVGRLADRESEAASAHDWERVALELRYLLRAHEKPIRRAAVNAYGYIARAIGPADVLHILLSNLKVGERTERVCTTVAIAIVAESCGPYTVIPALMNEYRVQEANIQHGVLKSLSFLFEYIGELGKDYCWAVVPLLEDALMDRDIVHRQMACNVVKHMALGVVGLGCEPALQHLLNMLFPNIFEERVHTINGCVEAIDACRVGLGPMLVMQYILQGLFHPARKVREIYWKLYNNTYIAAQDALVPAWPRIPSEGENNYWCTELDVFL